MRLRFALPAIAVLVTAVAGCGGGTHGALDVGTAEYVALGDSYTAAPGIGSRDDTNGCFRSANNYPHLVAKATGLSLADRSCSSANTTAISGGQTTLTQHTAPPQADALGPDTKVVTIGIGANDFNLIRTVIETCVAMARTSSSDSPCADAAATSKTPLTSLLSQLRGRLDGVLDDVRTAAPHARYLVVGYPSIVPASGTCAQMGLATGDYAFARSVVDGINKAEVAAAKAAGATYVDTTEATRGHDICAADPWIAGAKATKKGAPWHPYAEEQAAVAKLVEARIPTSIAP